VVAQIVIRDNGICPVYPIVEKRLYVFRQNALRAFWKECDKHNPEGKRVELSEEIERGKSLGFVLRVFSPYGDGKNGT
jgi:hypothetical protein